MAHRLFRTEETGFPIEVWEEGTERWLSFCDGATQTRMDRQEPHRILVPYLKTFLLALQFSPQAKSALVLGLGGGSMVHYLLHHKPKLKITTIEKYAEVVDVAVKYFGINEKHPNLNIKIAECLDYLQKTYKKHDLIFADIFSGDVPLNQKLGPIFFKTCAEHLSSKGTIAFNLVCQTRDDVHYAIHSLKKLFKQNLISISVTARSNWVFLASNNKIFLKVVKKLLEKNHIEKVQESNELGLICKTVNA